MTYFNNCPDCGHCYIHHLDLLKDSNSCCSLCKCKKVPPRYYVYDKDPTLIKDGLTLQHYEIVNSDPKANIEGFVKLVVQKLNS